MARVRVSVGWAAGRLGGGCPRPSRARRADRAKGLAIKQNKRTDTMDLSNLDGTGAASSGLWNCLGWIAAGWLLQSCAPNNRTKRPASPGAHVASGAKTTPASRLGSNSPLSPCAGGQQSATVGLDPGEKADGGWPGAGLMPPPAGPAPATPPGHSH